MTVDCRVMFTRRCPITGCVGLPCARFESDDETRWDLDKLEWEKQDDKKIDPSDGSALS